MVHNKPEISKPITFFHCSEKELDITFNNYLEKLRSNKVTLM
jgi:hypothetical protein